MGALVVDFGWIWVFLGVLIVGCHFAGNLGFQGRWVDIGIALVGVLCGDLSF